jgi:hypothetical protein
MNYTPVSKAKHFDKAVRPIHDLSFASRNLVVPIHWFEVRQAASSLPLIFIRRPDGKLKLYGLMGFEEGRNLLISPDGRWMAAYIPAVFNCYPFKIAVGRSDDKLLSVTEGSGMIVSKNDGDAFFNEDGSPGDVLVKRMDLLKAVHLSEAPTQEACDLIDELDLVKNTSFEMIKPDGRKLINSGGILSVNEKKFLELNETQYLKLRKTHALDLIYGNMFSMSCLSRLIHLMVSRDQHNTGLEDLGAEIFGSSEQDVDFSFS